jgi:hypothetical protein
MRIALSHVPSIIFPRLQHTFQLLHQGFLHVQLLLQGGYLLLQGNRVIGLGGGHIGAVANEPPA